MKQIIFFILLFTAIAYSQPIDTTGTGGITSIPDSVLFSSDSTNQRTFSDLKYVDKTSAQTITGQKNFSGTVKIGSDTSISLGYPYTTPLYGDVLTGLNIDRTDVYPYKYSTVFKVNTSDTNTSDWALVSLATDFIDTIDGLDHTLNLGSNIFGERQAPQFGMMMEDNYEFADSGYTMEWYLYYGDLPYPNTDYYIRPLMLGVEKYASGRQYAGMTMSVNRFFIGGTDVLDDRFDFQPMSTAYGGKLGAFFLNDSSWMKNTINDFGWLYQQSNDNSSIEMMRVDDLNNVVISPDDNRISRIYLKRPIYGSIIWDDLDSTGTIPIYREAGTNRIFIGGTDGMITNKLEVTNIPQDTSGLSSLQFYLDGSTGVVKYTLPENLLPEGVFTTWNGILKQQMPEGFYATYDTLHAYVEQDPVGEMHYVNDGTDILQGVFSSDSTTVGETYGYSFQVTQIVDTILFYIVNETLLLTATGTYSGVGDEITISRNFTALYKHSDNANACEITLDNIRIWQIGGNIASAEPTIYVPDTTGITDGYTPKYISGSVVWAPDVSTSGSGADSSVINDLIGTYIDTMASDTSDYTLPYIDKVVKNATISRYDISNPAVTDTFMIFWADDSLEVDSIKCWADDSTTIQIIMDETNMLSSAYLIDDGVSSTITTINEGTLLATKKARLYFTALGNAVKKVHLKIYWRYL